MTPEQAYAIRLQLGLPDTGREAWTFRARSHAWMYWHSDGAAERCHECDRAAVCGVCDACAAHCLMNLGPDECWEVHEAWRHGQPDRAFDVVITSRTLSPGRAAPAPLPRWSRTS